jgi:hypothetical protein
MTGLIFKDLCAASCALLRMWTYRRRYMGCNKPMVRHAPERLIRFRAGLCSSQADIPQHMGIKIAQMLALTVQGKGGQNALKQAGARLPCEARGAGVKHLKPLVFVMLIESASRLLI